MQAGLLLSFQCFVIAYVYATVLIKPDHVLGKPYILLSRLLTRKVHEVLPDNTPEEVKQMEGYDPKVLIRIREQKHWLLKPLGDCLYCTSGQLTLWAFGARHLLHRFASPSVQSFAATFWLLAFSICFTILMVITVEKLFARWSIK